MEEQYAALQMRLDEIWDMLQDPTLPPLDWQQLNEEVDEIHRGILEYERRFEVSYWDDDMESCESESIGPDNEYDRECIVVEGHFDLANEI